MIRVTVELIPPGVGRRRQELARLEIHNAGGTVEEADYSIKVVNRLDNGDISFQRRGLFGFRRRQKNALGLLYEALVALGPDALLNHDTPEIPERL